MMLNRSVILFTGQSGLKARLCLERLAENLEKETEILSIEEKMSETARCDFRRDILLESRSYQSQVWTKAFNDILKTIDDTSLTLITFHSVYYHQNTREFTSPLNLNALSKLKKHVKLLIILIDDIFDVYRRLLGKKEMFSDVLSLKKGFLDSVYTACSNIISLLNWRQVEITVSYNIGRLLDIPVYLVAVKHPAFMIARLIEYALEDLEIFYLSHPISSVREDAMEQLPNFTGELNLFSRKIIDQKNKVLFLPTTIDELIIKKVDALYTPEMLPRWPLPYDKEFWIAPPIHMEIEKINPLNPHKEAAEGNDREIASYLLKQLSNQIDTQITPRDLSMVDQSKNGLIVCRPYYPYRLSGGVRLELEHNFRLAQEERSRRCIVLSVTWDEGKARISRFFALLESIIDRVNSSTKRLLDNERYRWIHDPKLIKIFSSKASLAKEIGFIRDRIENVLPVNYKFREDFIEYRASLQPGDMGKQELRRYYAFQHILEELLKDPLQNVLIKTHDYYSFTSFDRIDINKILLKKKEVI